MNVLFVNNFRGRGGGEEFLRDVLPGLAGKGVRVGLVCRPETPLEDMFRVSAVTLHPVRRSGLGTLTSVFRMAAIIRRHGYGIINIQRGHDIIQSWLAALLSFRRPLLMYTPQVPEFIKSRFLLRRMDAIVTISRHIRDKLVAFDPALGPRTTIIYYGIDAEKFAAGAAPLGRLRERFGIPPDGKIIGTVGDLWKNQIEFLDVLARLRGEFPGIRYAIVGSTTGIGQIEAFKRRAGELGLADAVLWVGRLSKDDILSFYADIDLAVSTYRNEGFGIWILEAMAMGKPVVAFNAGGIRDSLEGCPAGVLVDGGAEEMAGEITRLFRDVARYRNMSGAAQEWVMQRFRRERMVDDYHRFFSSFSGELAAGLSAAHRRTPLRVLLMISKNDRYGAQRIFLDQAEALRRRGNEVVVAARGQEGYVADAVRSLGIPYYGIPMRGIGDLLFLRRLVRGARIDVIHTTLDRADYFGLLLAKLTNRPVVSTMMVPRYHPGFGLINRVVVLSRKQKELLEHRRVRPERVQVIRPGIDVDRFSRPDARKVSHWRQRLQAGRYSIIFCHISSVIPRKAHVVSLDVAAACKKRGEEPLLIIIGDSPYDEYQEYYAALSRKISAAGLDGHVIFTGWTPDIPEILSLCHFTILPSEREALGVVLMEGMAAGVPIIAREGEGGAELVEEFGAGFLFRPEEGIEPLTDGILALRKDRARYEALSERCRKIAAEEFSMAGFGNSLVEMYHTLRKAGEGS